MIVLAAAVVDIVVAVLGKRLGEKEAIFAEDDVPEDRRDYTELNAELAKIWPSITERKDPPVDADDWKDKPNKRDLLER